MMRRSASGVCGVGRVSGRGSGRLLAWVIVGDEGDDMVGVEAGAAVEEGELYEKCDAGDDAARVLDELAHSAGGAVLEFVGGGNGFAGEFVRLAGEDEPFAGAVGEGCAEDEAAGLG